MKTIQVRHVPEDLHRRLKARAALDGRSLSEYVLQELEVVAGRPSMADWAEATRTLRRPTEPVTTPASELIAAERR